MTRRERVFLRLGLAMVAMLITGLRGVPTAIRRYQGLADRVRLSRELVTRQEAELDLLPAYEARADSLRRRVLAIGERLVPGRTVAEAQAELLARVEHAAAGARGRLDQIEPLPDSVGFGRLRRVQARAAWISDLEGVLRFMRRIEYGAQLLVVGRLHLESLAAGSFTSTAQSLRAEVVVVGWYLSEQGQ